jgi:hypothetical protein
MKNKNIIVAVVAEAAALTLVAVLGYAMAQTLEREEPTAIMIPPPPAAAPKIDPDVQRLIDEVRKVTQAPAFHHVPFAGDVQRNKVWM